MTVVIVTGTGTGVGKTIATAAIAACASSLPASVAVVKPVQTGATASEATDVVTVARLSGCTSVHELVRLDDALSPDTAARLRAVSIPAMGELAAPVADIAAEHDVTIIEGAGGVAVRLDTAGGTIVTLAHALADHGLAPRVVVVTSVGLGTLNHTELTVARLRATKLDVVGLILGAVAPTLGLAESCNVDELPRVTGLPLVGRLPAGAGTMSGEEFQHVSTQWLEVDAILGSD